MHPLFRPRHSQPRGMTLTEMMVTVSILAILASLAVPSFSSFIYRTKRMEQETMVAALTHAIARVYQHERFPAEITLEQNPVEDVRVGKRPLDPRLGKRTGWGALEMEVQGELYYRYAAVADLTRGAESLMLTVTGDVDHDGRPNIRTIVYAWKDNAWYPVSDDKEDDVGDDW